MWGFLIPLLLGFALSGASAFTAAYSRRWGQRGGQLVSLILRVFLGIPLWVGGLGLAVRAPSLPLLDPSPGREVLGWLFIVAGSMAILLAIKEIGLRAAAPSVQDTLVDHGIYAHVRHPIYAGTLLEFAGLAVYSPTQAVVLACALGVGWVIIQARLEELDLLQRLPTYREYMMRVPRFFPRRGRRW